MSFHGLITSFQCQVIFLCLHVPQLPLTYRTITWCFQHLAILNKVAVHMCIHVQIWGRHTFSGPLDEYQGVGCLDQMVRVCLVLQENAELEGCIMQEG